MVEEREVVTGGSKLGRPLPLATMVKGCLFHVDQLETLKSSPGYRYFGLPWWLRWQRIRLTMPETGV